MGCAGAFWIMMLRARFSISLVPSPALGERERGKEQGKKNVQEKKENQNFLPHIKSSVSVTLKAESGDVLLSLDGAQKKRKGRERKEKEQNKKSRE